jgi:enoyl-[acyl-carrier protein] reductase II
MNCNILGRARAKRGMFEGDLIEGELEIGQIAGLIQEVKSAEGIILEMIADYNAARQEIVAIDF